MNGKIIKKTPFTRIYIPPDPGDGGGAMGAALYTWTRLSKQKPDSAWFPALGPSFSHEQIKSIINDYGLSYEFYDRKEIFLRKIASYLTKDKVIGWFQGRMEWGPRALGNRSILASARTAKMKDIINAKVKHRELFRPFAPVVLDKYVHTYFEADRVLSPSSKYMLMVYPFKRIGIHHVPATVHVDDTGRLQVLARADNPLYYDLIEAYRNMTGVPIIINTSFNVRGEPIVCTPRDAIECFLKTEIDYLAIDAYIITKKSLMRSSDAHTTQE